MRLELEDIRFGRGRHPYSRENLTGNRDLCIMEAVAFFAGEPWSDGPKCASKVAAAFLRVWNDALSNEDRDRLLPASVWVPRLINSRRGDIIEDKSAYLVHDWLVRTYAPAWFDLVPGLAEQASMLRETPPIGRGGYNTFGKKLDVMNAVVQQAREDAFATMGETLGVSGAGRKGIYAKGRVSALIEVTAGNAANEASYWVGWDAQVGSRILELVDVAILSADLLDKDLVPTTRALQQSALDLLERILTLEQVCGEEAK